MTTDDARCTHCGGKMVNYGFDVVCENDWYNISTGEKGSCPLAGRRLEHENNARAAGGGTMRLSPEEVKKLLEGATQGEWRHGFKDGSGVFSKHKGSYSSSVTVDDCLLATVHHHDETDFPADEPIRLSQANAALIAAAPEIAQAYLDMCGKLDIAVGALKKISTGDLGNALIIKGAMDRIKI